MTARTRVALAVGAGCLAVALYGSVLIPRLGGTPAPAPSLPAPVTEAPATVSTPPEAPDTDAPDVPEADESITIRTVRPGAYCSVPGAPGLTSSGKPMACKGPGRERWRAAS